MAADLEPSGPDYLKSACRNLGLRPGPEASCGDMARLLARTLLAAADADASTHRDDDDDGDDGAPARPSSPSPSSSSAAAAPRQPVSALASVAVPPSLPADRRDAVTIRLDLPGGVLADHRFAPDATIREVAALAEQRSAVRFDVDPDSRLPRLGLLLPDGLAPRRGVVQTEGGHKWLSPWGLTLAEAGIRRAKIRVVPLQAMDFDDTAAAASTLE